ncbi:MAG: D-alanine--D-alanine ligase family protein [Candidatus Binatia bacterium]
MSAGKRTVGIIFGGRSGEHPISIRSSRYVVDSLDRDRFEPVLIGIDRAGGWHLFSEDGYRAIADTVPEAGQAVIPVPQGGRCGLVDPNDPGRPLAAPEVIFPVLHGSYGEDGTIQGMLDMLDVAYVGVGVLGAAVCMDKDVCKRLLRDAGIPIVPYEVVTAERWQREPDQVRAAARRLGSPLFVKPASLGSSLGVYRVAEPGALDAAIEGALGLDEKILIERGIDGREIECAVLGNQAAQASIAGEIIPGEAFYSFEDKYAADSRSRLLIPAPLSEGQSAQVRDLAVRAFLALECRGMARVDFFLERSGGALYINELNTIPGFTSISMYPKLWAASGLDGGALVSRLIDLALERHAARHRGA